MATSNPQSIIIQCNRKICLNCDRFDHYFTPNRGNVYTWHPTDRGRYRKTGKELDVYKKACQSFEFVKPR